MGPGMRVESSGWLARLGCCSCAAALLQHPLQDADDRQQLLLGTLRRAVAYHSRVS